MIINLNHKFNRVFLLIRILFPSSLLVNRFSKLIVFLLLTELAFTQATISVQDFEGTPATPTMTYSNTNGATISGTSGAGDRPATSNYFTSSNTGFQATNTTSTITFMNNSGLAGCNTKYFEARLAAFSIGSTANGVESGDIATFAVSLDGGATYSNEVTVGGNAGGNSYWAFSATGIASITYDGNNTPTAFNAASSGSNAAGHSTIRIALPDACTQARLRITLLTNSASERWVIDDVKLIGTCPLGCTPDPEPTVQVSGISVSEGCTSAQINFTGGNGSNHLIVMSSNCTITDPLDQTNYNSSSTYGSGNTTAAGDYIVYNGTATTTIVSGLVPGTTYCFKIYEYNGTSANCTENYLLTGTSTSFTTLSSCAEPQIRSILVNACTVAEGTDEVVVITNGNNALDVDDISITFPSGGTFCNSGCGTQTFVNNASYVNDLNTLAGCALFVYATTIPANATVVVFTGSTPTMTFDYSSECPGGGPYYVLFANNTNTAGRFANDANANRTLTVDFGGSTDAVTFFSSNANTGDDGDYVSFDNNGTPTYNNTATCNGAVILPIELSFFQADGLKNALEVNWSTLSERNNAYFEVEISEIDHIEFIPVAQVKGAGSSSEENIYHVLKEDLKEGYYYVRLKQTDFDGLSTYSEIISATVTGDALALKQITKNSDGTHFVFNEEIERNATFEIVDITGKKIFEAIQKHESNVIFVPTHVKGLFILHVVDDLGASHTFKVILD